MPVGALHWWNNVAMINNKLPRCWCVIDFATLFAFYILLRYEISPGTHICGKCWLPISGNGKEDDINIWLLERLPHSLLHSPHVAALPVTQVFWWKEISWRKSGYWWTRLKEEIVNYHLIFSNMKGRMWYHVIGGQLHYYWWYNDFDHWELHYSDDDWWLLFLVLLIVMITHTDTDLFVDCYIWVHCPTLFPRGFDYSACSNNNSALTYLRYCNLRVCSVGGIADLCWCIMKSNNGICNNNM